MTMLHRGGVEGGVVTKFQGEGRCCDQVPCPCSRGGGEGGVVTRSHVHVPGEGGREVL